MITRDDERGAMDSASIERLIDELLGGWLEGGQAHDGVAGARSDEVMVLCAGPPGATEADGTVEIRGPRGEVVKVLVYPDQRIRVGWTGSGRAKQRDAKVVLAADG